MSHTELSPISRIDRAGNPVKIALFSHKFAPDVGGIETMSQLLATQFVELGHDVVVVTHSNSPDPDQFPFPVVRSPSALALLRIVLAVDVVFHNNICLQFYWPLMLVRRPWVVAVRTWIRRTGSGNISWRDRVKHRLLRRATVIAISKSVADHLGVRSTVIPNSYRDDIFGIDPTVVRKPGSLAFAGRLVPDKGVDVLLEAMVQLKSHGLSPTVTIAGDGPLRADLEDRTRELSLEDQVTFIGSQSPRDLAVVLNQHEVLVVPSLWDEPFGIVALEGIACGCVVVASRGGGLADAVGPCGFTFATGDVEELTATLRTLLTTPSVIGEALAHRASHLSTHTARHMAASYLETISAAASGRATRLWRAKG